jgi:hypothetical protein
MPTTLHLTNTIYSDTVLKHNVFFSLATKNFKNFDQDFNVVLVILTVTDLTGV